jgi:putative ABC transport system permease protein
MLRTTLRSLWSHKLRLVLTMLAIILGVSFMAGTLVLNATVGRVFDDLFGKMGQNIDAVARGEVLFERPDGGGDERALLDQDLVEQVAKVDGVAFAEGSIATTDATLIDRKGDPIGGFGPPTIVGSWDTDRQMASYQIDQGRAPEKPGEAVIDRGGADKGDFAIGQQVKYIGVDGKPSFLTLVGISRFGEADSAGGSIFVGVTLADAQRIAGEPGKVDQVIVRAAEGVTPEQLVERLDAANLSPGLDVITGQQASDEMASDIKQGLSFFTIALLVFAFISLFVAAFIISNTFSILLAQRTRELALLRAIGATRRQVLTSALAEAALIGVISSVLGFLAGIGLAAGALALLDVLGVDLPKTTLLVTPMAGIQVLLVGVIVTLVSAVLPAVRATRVPPIAALRSTAVENRSGLKYRAIGGLVLLVLGIVSILPAFAAEPDSDDLPGVGVGLGLLMLSILVLGPVIARPLARLAGSWLPSLKGVIGRLARENAMRSPRRTASTSAAIIIGVSLVVFISVFASSAQATIDKALGTNFESGYIVLPFNQGSSVGAPPEMAQRLRDVPGVAQVDAGSGAGGEITLPDGEKTPAFLFGITPETFGTIYNANMAEGTLDDLVPGTVLVDQAVARSNGIGVGDRISVTGQGGRVASFTVSALGDDPIVLGQWTINATDMAKLVPAVTDVFVGVNLEPGVSVDSIRGELRAVVDDYPNMRLQDKEQFRNSLVGLITALLNVILALLAVSIVIAFIGILNTMLLAIHERTRELGLLRAMGMTRSQMRSAVRWEAVIVSLIGTALGMGLGLGLSYVMVRALKSEGIDQFSVPTMPMIFIAGAAILLGILAAAWPAHKASKLNVLEAIATE